jgi:UrcA family protein
MHVAVLASALLSISTPGDAYAGHALDARLGALDLRTVSGAALAVQRLADAAKAYCRGTGAQASGAYDVTMLKCRRDMVRRAIEQLQTPQVTAAFEEMGAGDSLVSPAWPPR